MAKKHNWEKDARILLTEKGDAIDEVIVHGVKGEADHQITLEEVRTCMRYFGDVIGWWNTAFNHDAEFGMASYLALKQEAKQRGQEQMEVNALDLIPIRQKWLTSEAVKYFHDKHIAKYFTEQEQENMKPYLYEMGVENGIQ